jgi:hypothetical protein
MCGDGCKELPSWVLTIHTTLSLRQAGLAKNRITIHANLAIIVFALDSRKAIAAGQDVC